MVVSGSADISNARSNLREKIMENFEKFKSYKIALKFF